MTLQDLFTVAKSFEKATITDGDTTLMVFDPDYYENLTSDFLAKEITEVTADRSGLVVTVEKAVI